MRPFLIILLAWPAAAQNPPSQAQARQAVVRALPPELASRAGSGDLAEALERLPPEQRQAALRSLREKQGQLGDDPAVLAQLGSAYLGLGDRQQALSAAERVLARDPRNPDALGVKARALAISGSKDQARALMAQIPAGHPQRALVQSAIQLNREPSTVPAMGARPASIRPAAAPGRALQQFEQRINRLLAANRARSRELNRTLSDAGGFSVQELEAAGIRFRQAGANQPDAVQFQMEGDNVVISMRPDALRDGSQALDARATAHVANGARQAVEKDSNWVIRTARGWISAARTHLELAPDDKVADAANPSDLDLAAQRRILDLKGRPFVRGQDTLAPGDVPYMQMSGMQAQRVDEEGLFSYFVKSARSRLGGGS